MTAEHPDLAELLRRLEALEALEAMRDRSLSTLDRSSPRVPSHSLVDALPIGVALIDGAGRPLHANPALAEATGFSVEDLVDSDRPFPYWPADAPTPASAVLERAARGDRTPVEVELCRSDGEPFPARISAVALPGRDTEPGVTLLAVRDLGEERRARHELQKRLVHLKFLTRVSRELLGSPVDERAESTLAVLREAGTMYALDRIAFVWVEGSRSVVQPQWHRSVPLPEVLEHEAFPWIRSRLSSPEPIRVDGIDEAPAESSLLPRFMARLGLGAMLEVPLEIDGRLRGSAYFATDRGPRRWQTSEIEDLRLLADLVGHAHHRDRMHESLRASELRYRNVVEDQTDFIVRWKPDGTRTFVNESYCRAFDISREEAVGSTFFDLISPEDVRRVRERLRALTPQSPVSTAEHRVLLPDESIGWQRWTDRAVFDEAGALVEMQSVGRDITERKRAEETLERTLAELRAMKDRVVAENVVLREDVRLSHGFDEIIGSSDALRRCLGSVERVAPTASTVLILGETGTGKEMIAHKIHRLGPRADGPLICINCAALPAHLTESELFGHERGAFTGAERRRPGRFELADGGTLFLDEVGDLPKDVQAKLLRAIQDGRFERVGGTETLAVDVRVIAATHRDLEKAVAEGSFREDLFYRLSVFPIRVPPLAERREDIPELALHFVAKHARRLGRSVEEVSGRTLAYLAGRDWPGNIRELENWVERALITTSGPILDLGPTAEETRAEAAPGHPRQRLADVEREHIRRVLEERQWRIEGRGGAALVLGLRPSTLRSRMKRLGIARRPRG